MLENNGSVPMRAKAKQRLLFEARVKKSVRWLCLLTLWLSLGASAVRGAPLLHYQTSWIGNTFGFGDGQWVQDDIRAIAVAPDGCVYAITPWDESGGEIAEYCDGQVRRIGGRTHGWGNLGGDAIAANDKYVYAAVGINNEGGHLKAPLNWPSGSNTWWGVTRRLRSDISKGASFSDGLGNFATGVRRSFLKVNEESAPGFYITGLAANDHTLYVSNDRKNEVLVYDAESMVLQRRWPAEHPGKLAISPLDGSIWLSASKAAPLPFVRHYSPNGILLKDQIALPAYVIPSDISVDASGEVVIADSGIAQQVLVYARQNQGYELVRRVGEQLGVLAAPKGQVGPLRFDGLTGAAYDAKGNLYVSMNGIGLRPVAEASNISILGAAVRSFSPSQNLRWELQAQLFVDSLTVDPANPNVFYGPTKRFTYDYSQPPGKGWRYVATLVDRFKYPKPPFQFLQNSGSNAFYRYLDGHPILYSLSQQGGVLRIYRFDSKTDGTIAIPSGFIGWRNDYDIDRQTFGDNGVIWRNASGDGRYSASDVSHQMPPSTPGFEARSWFVDTAGGLWLSALNSGIESLKFRGLDGKGNPIYNYADLVKYPPPEPFNRIARVHYDVKHDAMYVTGYTASPAAYNPNDWGSLGRKFARYDRWSSGNRTPTYVGTFPWNTDVDPLASPVSFDIAGDYLFAVTTNTAVVSVFSLANGRLVGEMKPDAVVGNISGWVDMTNGITSYQRSSGEYVILVEDDARGKNIMYRWTPTQTSVGAP